MIIFFSKTPKFFAIFAILARGISSQNRHTHIRTIRTEINFTLHQKNLIVRKGENELIAGVCLEIGRVKRWPNKGLEANKESFDDLRGFTSTSRESHDAMT